jgi:amino acid transporter
VKWQLGSLTPLVLLATLLVSATLLSVSLWDGRIGKVAPVRTAGETYIITTPNQLTATALILSEWKTRDEVNPGVWIAIFLAAICAINYFGIKFFGELEFWLSSIKVLTIVRIAQPYVLKRANVKN